MSGAHRLFFSNYKNNLIIITTIRRLLCGLGQRKGIEEQTHLHRETSRANAIEKKAYSQSTPPMNNYIADNGTLIIRFTAMHPQSGAVAPHSKSNISFEKNQITISQFFTCIFCPDI